MPPPKGPTFRYRWNAPAYSYVDPRNGKFVSRRAVRDAIDRSLDGAMAETRRLSEALRGRQITLAEWDLAMARQVRAVHNYSAALAKGGRAQMGPADWGRSGSRIKEQLGFLRRFADQVRNGEQPLDGVFMRRSAMYVESGRRSFHQVERREMELRGNLEERSLLHAADHCEECVEEADAGWRPIGEMTPIGDRICRSHCRCTPEYR